MENPNKCWNNFLQFAVRNSCTKATPQLENIVSQIALAQYKFALRIRDIRRCVPIRLNHSYGWRNALPSSEWPYQCGLCVCERTVFTWDNVWLELDIFQVDCVMNKSRSQHFVSRVYQRISPSKLNGNRVGRSVTLNRHCVETLHECVK